MLLTLLGIDHFPHGAGAIIKSPPCPVRFDFVWPLNMVETPYVLVTSRGKHNHPPPIPDRPPSSVIGCIVRLIRRINDPSITYCKSYKA